MSEAVFRAAGGRPTIPRPMRGLVTRPEDLAPEDISWNFGVQDKTPQVVAAIQAKTSLHVRFPALAGKWDGASTVNHWDAIKKVLSSPEDLIQSQPRGTCGGRAGSFGLDALQCVLIAAGKRAKFHRVSHAAVYYIARKISNMVGGSWQDENQDGVAGGAVPEAVAKLGVVQREEDGDSNWYGAGSDDLACKLGAGLLPDVAKKILELGKDNVVTEWVPVHDTRELADGIAAGGIGIGSDSTGFTMTRNGEGCCTRSGTWEHYQVRVSVQKGVRSGRTVFGYNQSWGRTTPDGPRLPGHPGNCFGIYEEDMQHQIDTGDWAVVFGFPLWDLESGSVDIPWTF